MTTRQSQPRPRRRKSYAHRIEGPRRQSDEQQWSPEGGNDDGPVARAFIDCGWGRLLFGQTFEDPDDLARQMRRESAGQRDIAFYIQDPHVVLAAAPQELFLDPSHTYRIDLATYRPSRGKPGGFVVRRLSSNADAAAVNRIYVARGMVPVQPEFFWSKRDSRAITHFVAEDIKTGEVIGTVTGVDHFHAFKDPQHGFSLWCLAVDPQASFPGIGETLVRRVIEHAQARGARHLDLSVIHDNDNAIALYEKLGFRRVPLFAVKRRNEINECLFTDPPDDAQFNPYARIIIREARRRGIDVEVVDVEGGFFRLHYGGRSIICREALSQLTSGVAVSICDDKAVTRRLVERAGISVPDQMEAPADGDEAGAEALRAFISKHGAIVVKPARGEQGRGVAVGITNVEDAREAIKVARSLCDRVLVEQCVAGEDLRLLVIDGRVVAAAIRKPARIIGDGRRDVRRLIEAQSRRRAAATDNESSIPMDAETERCVAAAGLSMDDVPEEGREILVRKTANLHTGGTIHDVTDICHPRLVEAAIRIARTIDIPVVGIDFLVSAPDKPDYVFIEANERPGLANHEPQPTAERFVDLLFPLSLPAAARQAVSGERQDRE